MLNSRGSEETNLLGVLQKALHHAGPQKVGMCIRLAEMEGKMEEAIVDLSGRMGLISRHMLDVQKSLKEIYDIAQKKEYTEIKDVFERKYLVGHPVNPLEQ